MPEERSWFELWQEEVGFQDSEPEPPRWLSGKEMRRLQDQRRAEEAEAKKNKGR